MTGGDMTSPRPAWMNSWSGSAVCLLIAAAVGWLLLTDFRDHSRLQAEGQRLTVQVIDRAEFDHVRGENTYWLRVRTSPPWERTVQPFKSDTLFGYRDERAEGLTEVKVSRFEFEAVEPGGQFAVLYRPERPEQLIAPSVLTYWQPSWYGMLAFLAILAGAAAFAWDSWRARRKL